MMKLLFLFTALILSATAYAEEANDTTFNVKDKKIVVDVQDNKTIVKVYDNNGFQLLKHVKWSTLTVRKWSRFM